MPLSYNDVLSWKVFLPRYDSFITLSPQFEQELRLVTSKYRHSIVVF